MKIVNIFSLLIFWMLCINHSDAQTNLYIKEKMGSQIQIPIDQIKALSFSDRNLTLVKVDGTSEATLLSLVRYISFREYTETVITDINMQISAVEPMVFPNPVQQVLFIAAENSTGIEIINALGELVFQTDDASETSIDVSGLAPGVYICRVHQGTRQSFKKFIKE